VLPDADPAQLLDAFLAAHAQGGVATVLYARGEELHRRLAGDPPALPAWGRFLVAMGELAAERFDDPATASRYFLAALQGVGHHGDHEAAVTAGYDQGVLAERLGRGPQARAAYRAAANEGFRVGCVSANTVRSAAAAVRLHFAEYGDLRDVAALAKRAWLGWLWLRRERPTELDAGLESELGRQLAALLLPEDDPALLVAAWRAWAPGALALPDGGHWRDDDPACLDLLFAVAGEAADRHLADEGPEPGAPYRLLRQALRRTAGS
jgi:hypothetical protein